MVLYFPKAIEMRKIWLVLFTGVLLYACSSVKDLPPTVTNTGWKAKSIPASPQQNDGDPEAGFDYISNGDYIGSGIPYEVFEKRALKGKMADGVLDRPGINEKLPYTFTAFKGEGGVEVVNGNCFTCHAAEIDGKTVLGLGNSFSDFRISFKTLAKAMDLGMKVRFGKKSEEWAAYKDFRDYFRASAPYIKTNQPGANPAAVLAEACVMHRNPEDLTYSEKPNYTIPDYAIATDVPPLWHLKKKNALYYTAVGRGDFTKLLFQASVLGIADTTAARNAITNFKDVIAWIKTIEPPAYPYDIDRQYLTKGAILYEKNCSECHGSYGLHSDYPNKVVSLDAIKTDPLYASYAMRAPIVEWYNESWFATSEPTSYFEPEAGYIAPPLDGIWATAPYLHNGSVPTLEDLLNSYQRPTYWKRSGKTEDYDREKVGWNYTTEKNGKGKWNYDTTLPGYSNAGHYYGDHLTADERKAVIEYLKTL